MTQTDMKLQSVKLIPVLGLHALLGTLISAAARTIKQGDIDPSHKTVATIALLIKTIKEADVYNDSFEPSCDSGASAAAQRDPLSPEELRLRLTRYLKRLDDDVAPPRKGPPHDKTH